MALQGKPHPWNVSRANTDPRYDSLWNGLELYHILWEGGGSPRDYSGNHNTGTLVNSPVWSNTRLGRSVVFGGGNDYVDTNFNLDTLGVPFTIVVECMLTSGDHGELFGSSAGDRWSVAWFNNTAQLNWQDDTDGDIKFDYDQQVNVPQQFVFIKRGAGIDLEGYANAKPLTGSAGGSNNPSGTTVRYGSRGSSLGWTGPIWSFRIYSRALHKSEVKLLYADMWGSIRQFTPSLTLAPAPPPAGGDAVRSHVPMVIG